MKKFIFTTTVICTLIFGACGISANDKFETWYVGANSGLNCRRNPMTNSEVLAVYPRGEKLQIIGIDSTGDWWETWDGTIQGWCQKKYLVSDPNSTYCGGTIGRYLGVFRGTGYTSAPYENGGSTKTAMGDILTDVIGYAIAADPKVIPMNSKVYIEGIGYRVVRDTGGAIKGNKIDILTNSNAESLAITGNYNVYLVD